MKPEVDVLKHHYPSELWKHFPTLLEKVNEFHLFTEKLEVLRGTNAVNLDTPKRTAQRSAKELQDIARIVCNDIIMWHVHATELYRLSTAPAHEARTLDAESAVGIIPGEHFYFVLDRERHYHKNGHTYEANDLLVLLQRVPFGVDTGAEIHGITENLESAPYGGIEVYLPLVDDIEFLVNGTTYRPKGLEQLITIYPGDVHHHRKIEGDGPSRVLIVAGFHFKRGVKTEDTRFIQQRFENIRRMTDIK